MRQGPRRPAGILRYHLSAFPALGLAPGGKYYPGVWAPWPAVPSGLRGKAQAAAPAQFSLTASQALPAWLRAQPRKRAGDRGGGGRARPAWSPGKHNRRDLQRGQHGVAGASSAPQARGRQAARREVPSLEQGRVRPDLDCIKVRKRPTIT